ncbi:MAG: hypothetical protein PHP07_08605 [Eubacteriales bacterium]|nr:hypothetical protein [Eubacteriales bacterium]
MEIQQSGAAADLYVPVNTATFCYRNYIREWAHFKSHPFPGYRSNAVYHVHNQLASLIIALFFFKQKALGAGTGSAATWKAPMGERGDSSPAATGTLPIRPVYGEGK